MNSRVEHSINLYSLWLAIASVVGVILVWQLLPVVMLVLTAMLLAAALTPLVRWLNRLLPLSIAALIILIGISIPVVWLLATVVPSFIAQIPTALDGLTAALRSATFLPWSIRTIDLAKLAPSGGEYLISSTPVILEYLAAALALIFLTFYIIIDVDGLNRLFFSFVPTRNRQRIITLVQDLVYISGRYVRGNLLISFICGVTIFIGLLILDVPYAGQLAVFTAIMDLFPLVGSLGGSIPALILAFIISPVTGMLTLVLYVCYQQIENHILTPAIYNKALNLMPTFSVIAVIIGGYLFGIGGAFLSLPIAAGIPVFVRYFKEGAMRPDE